MKCRQKILVPALAVCLGFFVNGVRVVLMAVLVTSSHRQAFEYWHMGTGSLIFSLIASFIFGLLCLFLLQLNAPATVNKK